MNKRFAKRTAQVTLMIGAGILALGMGGCTTDEVASSSDAPAEAAKNPTATQSFAKPLVAQKEDKKTTGTSRVMGLLQSTDPTERARQVQAGIGKGSAKDPFSSVPSILSFKMPAPELKNNASTPPNSAPVPAPSRSTPIAAKPPVLKPSQPSSAIAALPPLPDSSLANSVEITGVIVVGGVPQAIVKAPNEATSRYVQAGQRLSNGQILVKRIEMNNGSDPIVILEQNGVEVAKSVGSPSTPGPTAFVSTAFWVS